MHNVTHILLWRHCDSKSFTVVLVGGPNFESIRNLSAVLYPLLRTGS